MCSIDDNIIFLYENRKPIFKHISQNYLSGFKSGTDTDGNHQPNEFNENSCVICRRGFEKAPDQAKDTQGLANLIKFSEFHGRHELHAHLLHQNNKVRPDQVLVHNKCCSPFVDYKHLNKIGQGQASCNPKKQKLRSASGEFNWKENCFFCVGPVIFDDRHPDRNKDSRVVRTIPLRDDMLSKCCDCLDSCAKQVKGRLENCIAFWLQK